MGKRKDTKTNAMRIADAAGLSYEMHSIDTEGAVSGVEAARLLGQDPAHVFKTLVTTGKSGEHYVFMIPAAEELDLKKAAATAGEKAIAMLKSRDLFDLTGYVHGGCSPLGMKHAFPTFIDETCVLFDTILFSAGRIGMHLEMAYEDLGRALPLTLADLIV